MQQVREVYCIGPGAPEMFGELWLRANLKEVVRTDPFTGKRILVPVWEPDDAVSPDNLAKIYGCVELETNESWASASRILQQQSSALHDGILFELWTLIIGQAEAAAAWRPSWMTRDGSAQMMDFPADVTRWLGTAADEAVKDVLRRWDDLPYLETAAGPSAWMVGQSLFHTLTPLARLAIVHGAKVVARLSGYVLP